MEFHTQYWLRLYMCGLLCLHLCVCFCVWLLLQFLMLMTTCVCVCVCVATASVSYAHDYMCMRVCVWLLLQFLMLVTTCARVCVCGYYFSFSLSSPFPPHPGPYSPLPLLLTQDIDFFQHLEMHMRSESSNLVGRDHLSFRSSYVPCKVKTRKAKINSLYLGFTDEGS